MEKPKKPNPLADLMARDIVGEQLLAVKQKFCLNAANSAAKPNSLSPATLKALARFGPGNQSNIVPTSKPQPLPLPVTDWELWAHMPKATLTETVAVSLGIDPSATKPGSGYVEPGKEYDRRLKIACAYVSHAGPLKSLDTLPPMHLLYGPSTATVSLPQFAEWALSMGWTLPEQFPRWKAAPVKTVKQQPAPEQSLATPAPVVVAGAWVAKAQARAREIVRESKERDRYPSQENLGDTIAAEFRKAGIVGADGKPLTGATIKRHALKGISSATGKQLSTTIGRGK